VLTYHCNLAFFHLKFQLHSLINIKSLKNTDVTILKLRLLSNLKYFNSPSARISRSTIYAASTTEGVLLIQVIKMQLQLEAVLIEATNK
jgi:hypothetical protein